MRMLHAIAFAIVIASAAPALAQPQIVALSDSDEASYRRAFTAADRGDANGARAAMRHVDDDALVNTALGRAYLKANRRSYRQVVAWLDRNPDLAIADAVYDHAQRIRPKKRRRLTGPAPPSPTQYSRRPYPNAPMPPPGDSSSARMQIASLQDSLGAGTLDWRSAEGALYGPRAGEAAWILGLAAFRTRDYASAVRYFETSANWPHHWPSARAAAHYWAARALLAAGQGQGVTAHLEAAAGYPPTFYGQLAELQLGRSSALSFESPTLEPEAVRAFMERYPAARRAAALAQIGRLSEVEAELRILHTQIPPHEDKTYLGLAEALEAPSAQLRAAEYGGRELAAGLCPTMTFAPADGFQLDRALIYAVVRQESYFNPVAVSSSNARGLMQLLPSTASDMDRSRNYRRNPAALFDPSTNLNLGQNYVMWLMSQFHQDRDLGRVFAAYNGGPGWLQRWLVSAGENEDPLMVLETLPRAESRDYAERVLSHMALCRRKFGQPAVELEALASGRAAIYRPLDRMAMSANAAAP